MRRVSKPIGSPEAGREKRAPAATSRCPEFTLSGGQAVAVARNIHELYSHTPSRSVSAPLVVTSPLGSGSLIAKLSRFTSLSEWLNIRSMRAFRSGSGGGAEMIERSAF